MTDTNVTSANSEIERKTYTVLEIAVLLGIGKNQAYELCKTNQFRIIKVGRAIKVVKQSFDSWMCGNSQN